MERAFEDAEGRGEGGLIQPKVNCNATCVKEAKSGFTGVTPRNNAALEWLSLPLIAVVEWVFLRCSTSSPLPLPP